MIPSPSPSPQPQPGARPRPKVYVDLVYTTAQLAQMCVAFLGDELALMINPDNKAHPDVTLALTSKANPGVNVNNNITSDVLEADLTRKTGREGTPNGPPLTAAWIAPLLSKLPEWGNMIVSTTLLSLRHFHLYTKATDDDLEDSKTGSGVLARAPIQVLFVLALLRACDASPIGVAGMRARVVEVACADPVVVEFLGASNKEEKALDELQREFGNAVGEEGEDFVEVREFEEGLVERYIK